MADRNTSRPMVLALQWLASPLIGVSMACEDAYSRLVEVVTIADVDDENRVGKSLLQIWKLRFGHKALLLFRL